MKTLHIISHTHWDREWYMSFEDFRMRLVELFDTLIETMENNSDFKYFHLDGQMILIDDYLEIRPYMRDRLLALIRAGRIQVGPWYILQDEFLTSGEANVRNMIEGLRRCEELDVKPLMSGYMPDAFGNISQLPQILRGFDIDNAVFGRGIEEIFADNTSSETPLPPQTDLIWSSHDGSKVIGVMFRNWYNNANEMPTDEKEVKERYGALISATTESAKSPNLLGMNGGDHQPIQKTIPESIAAANRIFGKDVEIKHSNFHDYIAAIRPFSDSFYPISGELTGQHTSGQFSLVSTASTHIPIKQKNHRVQNLLSNRCEPLSAFSKIFGDEYRFDMIRHAWKLLMQSHPHDTICCCSCDEVIKETDVRLMKAEKTAEYVLGEAIRFLSEKIDTSIGSEKNIIVFHTNPKTTETVIKTNVYFKSREDAEALALYDFYGNQIPCQFKHLGGTFRFELPKDSFRKSSWDYGVELTFPVKLTGMGCFAYKLVKDGSEIVDTAFRFDERTAQNDTLRLEIADNGTLTVYDLVSGSSFKGLNYFEDTGDIGDSYNYFRAEGQTIYTLSSDAQISVFESNSFSVTYKILQKMNIPVGLSADHKKRSDEKIVNEIISYVTLSQGIHRIDIKTHIENKSEDHRIRAVFPTDISTSTVFADGQFDVLERNIVPWNGWTNPENLQRMQAFFALEDNSRGLLIAARGLHEYEVLRDERTDMALTLLRSIGRIGDWGHFPTPDMQLKRPLNLEYAIIPYSPKERATAFERAYSISYDRLVSAETDRHDGVIAPNESLAVIKGDFVSCSAFKRAESSDDCIMRIYNSSDTSQTASIRLTKKFTSVFETNLAEDKERRLNYDGEQLNINIPAKKIITLLLKQN